MTAATGHGRRRVVSLVLAGAAGALFGAGLVVSGMTQPARVIGFLDVGSAWDPSLGFVMAGAVVVYAILFRWIRRQRSDPWFDEAFHLPTRRDIDRPLIVGARSSNPWPAPASSRRDIDRPLIVGAALFGVGWGLGGLCPGPGIVSAASGSIAGLAFVAAMLLGMHLQRRLSR